MSENVSGEPISVSGMVAIPDGPAPAGGWPVISWAHGTTGVADACAPSADTPNGPVHDTVELVSKTLDKWVGSGYVVVQTDYEGIGTPGGHPYLNGTSRQVDDNVGKDWFAVGHSQGGQAVVFASAIGPDRAPELNVKGAVSIAPGNGTGKIPQMVATGDPLMAPGVPFVPIILLGVQAVDPTIVPEEL